MEHDGGATRHCSVLTSAAAVVLWWYPTERFSVTARTVQPHIRALEKDTAASDNTGWQPKTEHAMTKAEYAVFYYAAYFGGDAPNVLNRSSNISSSNP